VTGDQSAKVVGVEPHRASQVNSGELPAFDQALDGARVDVEEDGDLLGRQERSGDRYGGCRMPDA
jgi:hypothetical protein